MKGASWGLNRIRLKEERTDGMRKAVNPGKAEPGKRVEIRGRLPNGFDACWMRRRRIKFLGIVEPRRSDASLELKENWTSLEVIKPDLFFDLERANSEIKDDFPEVEVREVIQSPSQPTQRKASLTSFLNAIFGVIPGKG